jgi:hypothetical protein
VTTTYRQVATVTTLTNASQIARQRMLRIIAFLPQA